MIRSAAPERRYAILAEGRFADTSAKTAHGLIRYGKDEVVCVMDSTLAGSAAGVFPDLGRDAPIVGTLQEALELSPTSVLVGLAPAGGRLPEEWMETCGLRRKRDSRSSAASTSGSRPSFPANLFGTCASRQKASCSLGEGFEVGPKVALTVGTDSAIGKMTATLEIERPGRPALSRVRPHGTDRRNHRWVGHLRRRRGLGLRRGCLRAAGSRGGQNLARPHPGRGPGLPRASGVLGGDAASCTARAPTA